MKPVIHLVLNTLHVLVWPVEKIRIEVSNLRDNKMSRSYPAMPVGRKLQELFLMHPIEGVYISIPIRILKQDETPLYPGVEKSKLMHRMKGELCFDAETNKAWVAALASTLADARNLSTKNLKVFKTVAKEHSVITPAIIWDSIIMKLDEKPEAIDAMLATPDKQDDTFVPKQQEKQGEFDI